jgi:helicase
MNVSDLLKYGATQEMVDALANTGLTKLYPPQVLAVKAGLLMENKSFVVSAPTASGKTVIAEMAAFKVFLEKRGKVIYTVPLRALAREKYDDLSKKYAKIGMRVEQSTGDFDKADPWLRKADLIISTNEKIDSLLRHRVPWLSDVRLVIADEVHLIGDGHRGPTLEIVLTRLKQEMQNLRIIALSATIPNAGEISRWLGAELITSNWRPVPLREGVYFDGAVIFNDGTVTWVNQETRVDAIDLAAETVRGGGQVLIFVNSRKSAEAVANKAGKAIFALLDSGQREELKKTAEKAMSAVSEPTRLSKKISDQVVQGVAFHHAGILFSQRMIIEDAFRRNKIKLIAATTTLAMGLNLPSRRVIIRDWRRFESGTGMVPIPVMEIKQMSGRAGRPGFDSYGEAVLIAGNKRDERVLFERYVKGKPEDVKSRLGTEAALRMHILASIAGGFAATREELIRFLGQTLSSFQAGPGPITTISQDIVAFLVKEGLIIEKEQLSATRLGRRISELYLDPLSGIMLRESMLLNIEKRNFGLLHMVARTPDMVHFPVRESEIDDMLALFHGHADSLLLPEKRLVPAEEQLAEIKAAALLSEWIQESHEDRITDLFNVGPGDLHTAVELADWLLYSAQEIARILRLDEVQHVLVPLRERVMYGVKEELLPLVSFKGIGRIRARNLFNAGYKGRKNIRQADVKALEKVPAIGKGIAEDIKKQAAADAAA